MPEQRGREHHRKRIGETLKEEIGTMLEGELGDPRIALCTVTEIADVTGRQECARVHTGGRR